MNKSEIKDRLEIINHELWELGHWFVGRHIPYSIASIEKTIERLAHSPNNEIVCEKLKLFLSLSMEEKKLERLID